MDLNKEQRPVGDASEPEPWHASELLRELYTLRAVAKLGLLDILAFRNRLVDPCPYCVGGNNIWA